MVILLGHHHLSRSRMQQPMLSLCHQPTSIELSAHCCCRLLLRCQQQLGLVPALHGCLQQLVLQWSRPTHHWRNMRRWMLMAILHSLLRRRRTPPPMLLQRSLSTTIALAPAAVADCCCVASSSGSRCPRCVGALALPATAEPA